MRYRAGVCMLVLATVLMGTLIVGSPVVSNDSVAATTAGIDLGTPPRTTSMIMAEVSAAAARPFTVLLTLVLLLVGATSLILAVVDVAPLRPLLRWGTTARRGPPASA